MTDKFKPIPTIPKTETKIVLNDWWKQYPVKKSNLSTAARSKVINKSGSNYLSENEGYGPCYVCDEDPKPPIEFKMACPAEKCEDREAGYWYHNNYECKKNKSRMLITNRGFLSCGGCGTGYNMANWQFLCSKHDGGYKSMNKDSWNKSMALALNLADVNEVTQDLNVFVTNHPEKFGFDKKKK